MSYDDGDAVGSVDASLFVSPDVAATAIAVAGDDADDDEDEDDDDGGAMVALAPSRVVRFVSLLSFDDDASLSPRLSLPSCLPLLFLAVDDDVSCLLLLLLCLPLLLLLCESLLLRFVLLDDEDDEDNFFGSRSRL